MLTLLKPLPSGALLFERRRHAHPTAICETAGCEHPIQIFGTPNAPIRLLDEFE